jgi:hypothetical protein
MRIEPEAQTGTYMVPGTSDKNTEGNSFNSYTRNRQRA